MIQKKKISELPVGQMAAGLKMLATNANNQSVQIDMGEVIAAKEAAEAAAGEAEGAAEAAGDVVAQLQSDYQTEVKSDYEDNVKGEVMHLSSRVDTLDHLSIEDTNAVARQLTSAPTESVFTHRVSPTPTDGLSLIKEMRGNSLVWNQLALPFNSSSWSGTIRSGATIEARKISVTLTSARDLYHGTEIDTIIGHTYALIYGVNSPSNNAIIIVDSTVEYTASVVTGNTAFYSRKAKSPQISFRFRTYDAGEYVFSNAMIIDLTQMFGAGNEPTTYAEFLVRKPKVEDEFAYNAGTIVNNKVTSIEVSGRNLWDEEWKVGSLNANGDEVASTNSIVSKNYIPCYGNTPMNMTCLSASNSNFVVYFYDKNNTMIPYTGTGAYLNGYNGSASVFVPPIDAVKMRFRGTATYGDTYKHDICINISDPTFNGKYEPHHTASFDCDWKKVEDTTWGKYTFDGTENWIKIGTSTEYRYYDFPEAKKEAGRYTLIRCNYGIVTYHFSNLMNYTNNSCVMYNDGVDFKGVFAYRKDECQSVAEWKAYLAELYASGHPLVVEYALADPSTYEGEHPLLFPNGRCSAGTAYDESTQWEDRKRVGEVDLGELSFTYNASRGFYYVFFEKAKMGSKANAICSTYATSNAIYSSMEDKSILVGDGNFSSTPSIIVKDSSLGDSGKPSGILNYELATPIVLPHAERKMIAPTFVGGTERVVAMRPSKNIWDEEWELGDIDVSTGANVTNTTQIRSKNFIPISGEIYFHCGGTSMHKIIYYDAYKNRVGSVGWIPNGVLTPVSGTRYMRFVMQSAYGTTYNHNICINLSDSSFNGKYEPYGVEYEGGATTPMRAEIGYPISSKEIEVENQATIAIMASMWGIAPSKVGAIRFDDYLFNKLEANANFSGKVALADAKSHGKTMCARYSYADGAYSSASMPNLSMGLAGDRMVYCRDDSYTTASAFNESLKGLVLWYEKA